MGNKTALHQWHCDNNAKLVDFSNWDMPINYGSQLQEHHAVRQAAGMFDVSHMTVVDITGDDATVYLQKLLANDVARIAQVPGKALYSAMLNEHGGVLDDLIVYRTEHGYRTVVNCATRAQDLSWLQQHSSGFDVVIRERDELAMIAVQGPQAIERVKQVVDTAAAAVIAQCDVFFSATVDEVFFARTGYTGEDGLEIILPSSQAVVLWEALFANGVVPCGLGARDTLRLEAGMNLYGHEMDETVSPLVANMAWTIAWAPETRDFIGRSAIESQRSAGVDTQLVGLVMEAKGVLRAGQSVVLPGASAGRGEITSGTFSPTLGKSIAMARVPAGIGDYCDVEIRHKRIRVNVVKPCFVRNGRSLID